MHLARLPIHPSTYTHTSARSHALIHICTHVHTRTQTKHASPSTHPPTHMQARARTHLFMHAYECAHKHSRFCGIGSGGSRFKNGAFVLLVPVLICRRFTMLLVPVL